MKVSLDQIGACGRACFVCRYWKKGICKSCKIENKGTGEEACLLYKCVQEKGSGSCLQCSEKRPCRLWRGLSMGYCPVLARLNLKKTIK